MLEALIALDISQREMRRQFETGMRRGPRDGDMRARSKRLVPRVVGSVVRAAARALTSQIDAVEHRWICSTSPTARPLRRQRPPSRL